MESRTIKLSLEEAKELYHAGGKFKVLALQAYNEEELTLPTSWEEFCSNKFINSEYYITSESSVDIVYNDDRNPFSDKNILPSNEDAEAHLALMQLHQLRDCYRKGWKPDWHSGDSKYCIEHVVDNRNNSYYIKTYATFIKFLSFQSEEVAKFFLNNFKDLIKKANDLV